MKAGDRVRISPRTYLDEPVEWRKGGIRPEYRGKEGVVTHFIDGKRHWNQRDSAWVFVDSILSDPELVPTLDHWPLAWFWASDLDEVVP